jgi:glycosyltransferase involved in cell wall biosynthesis
MTPEPPPLRALIVITKSSWGGAQRYVYDLATSLAERGHEVAVAYGTPGLLNERLDAAGIRTIPLSGLKRDVSLLDEPRAFFALLSLLRRERPDVLHLNSSKAGGLGALAGRLARVPRILFTAHGWAWNEDRPAWQKAAIAFLAYLTVLLSHATICVSHAVKHGARWMPLPASRFMVIRNGVRPPAFLPREEAREALAPATGARTWIGMLSELHPTKRVIDAVNAFALIARTHPDAALVILGGGQEYTDLELLIYERGLADRVVLAGFVPEGARYLRAFDVFLHASLSEALPYAPLEAGLAGLPVVATRVGGIPEIVENRKSGILVPPLRPDLIAVALAEYLDDPARAEAFGGALKERVAASFGVERMVEETLRAYALAH